MTAQVFRGVELRQDADLSIRVQAVFSDRLFQVYCCGKKFHVNRDNLAAFARELLMLAEHHPEQVQALAPLSYPEYDLADSGAAHAACDVVVGPCIPRDCGA